MELIDNRNKTLKDDLASELNSGSKLSIAAACFSIYAFQELKNELKNIDELRFIFTAPSFTTENTPKEKREFYIPRTTRERNLYGTEFEVTKIHRNVKAVAEKGNSLEEQIAVDAKRAKILKEIARLEALARKEKQPKKKFELVERINILRKEVGI